MPCAVRPTSRRVPHRQRDRHRSGDRLAAAPDTGGAASSRNHRRDRCPGGRSAHRYRRTYQRLGARSGAGSRAVEIRLDGHAYPARYGIARDRRRADQARVSGFGRVRIFRSERDFAPLGVGTTRNAIVAVNRQGGEAVLARTEPSATRALPNGSRSTRVAARRRRAAVLRPAGPLRHRAGRRERARQGVFALHVANREGRDAGADPLFADDARQDARLGIRSRLEHRTALRRASHRRGFLSSVIAYATLHSCRCCSRSTAASGPTPSAMYRNGTSTIISNRTRPMPMERA